MQVYHWPKGQDVSILVKAFFENDPYYPRPFPTGQLYVSFKTGYLNACDPEDRIFATAFFTAIETEQATRSMR